MFKSKGIIFSIIFLCGLFIGEFVCSYTGWTLWKNKNHNKMIVPISGTSSLPGSGSLIDLESAFVRVSEEIKPAVVNLRIEKKVKQQFLPWFQFRNGFDFGSPFDEFFKNFFGEQPNGEQSPEYKEQSLGTGVIVDEKGYILTNNHVIKGADEIKVMLLDGRKFNGKIVGSDPKTDLALIKVDAKDLPTARLGNSDNVKIGSWAIAIGNPFGLEHTVTIGVISAKGRAIGAAEYEDLLQTDASINPGNSGGPLVNIYGEVIGINTAIVAGGQGIGFAIPINMATRIIGDLMEHGRVERAWLGVYIQPVTPELIKEFEGAKEGQVMVKGVMTGSPAEKAGILPGDIILSVNDNDIQSPQELQKSILKNKTGTKVELSILRKGKKLSIDVILTQMPEEKDRKISQKDEEKDTISFRGMTIQDLTKELSEYFDLDKNKQGVIISDVAPNSPAHQAGIKKGDVLKEINHQPIKDLRAFEQVIKKIPEDKSILLVVKRKGFSLFIILGGMREK